MKPKLTCQPKWPAMGIHNRFTNVTALARRVSVLDIDQLEEFFSELAVNLKDKPLVIEHVKCAERAARTLKQRGASNDS